MSGTNSAFLFKNFRFNSSAGRASRLDSYRDYLKGTESKFKIRGKLKEVFEKYKILNIVAQLVEHPDFDREGTGYEFNIRESLKKFSKILNT